MADAATLLVLWPVLIPIATAALTAALWRSPAAQRWVGMASLMLLLAASLALTYVVATEGVVAKQFGDWAAPFGITFVADPLSAAMIAISGVLAFAVGIFALSDIRPRHERNGFHPLFHGLMAGVNGAFLTGDIFNLYVWFEVMLITTLGLLVVQRGRAQIDGALKYAAMNLFGTILFLIAVALLYGATGTLNMADLARILPGMEMSPGLTASALLFLAAFGIKAGVFPLFFWLPASYHTAPIAIAALFAGLLTKVGVYAAFRVFTLLFEMEGGGLREIVAVVAALTMITGVFGAAIQWNVRRILSFHIISQIGYMLMGLAIATPVAIAGAVFYIVHHIIVKANLFLLAGAIRKAAGTDDLRKAGGLLKSHPWLAVLFLIPALSLAGLPPLSGFWAKFLVIDASLREEVWWLAAVALLVGALTLFSMSKIWMEAFWKKPVLVRATPRRVPVAFVAPIVLLGAVTLTIGLFADPFVEYARTATAVLVDPADYIAAVFPEEGPVQAAGTAYPGTANHSQGAVE
ncbi:Na+/H+ antiporter subunit D [Salinarimonas rosea]|uniref:Na+/H+ antiporter subunit D n=1 Tax=Salinarimonas rosea TaxID=552063 RepID=UPI00040C5C9F|nr:Na+/H+ antiporter subunit D [Salinarimonas rosea]